MHARNSWRQFNLKKTTNKKLLIRLQISVEKRTIENSLVELHFYVLVKCWFHVSWAKITNKNCSVLTKSWFLSNVIHQLVYLPVSEHFSFAKIIHSPDRCGISRSWLNTMIITQVHLVWGQKKDTLKYAVLSHNTMCQVWGSVQLAWWLQECSPELLPENVMFISLP